MELKMHLSEEGWYRGLTDPGIRRLYEAVGAPTSPSLLDVEHHASVERQGRQGRNHQPENHIHHLWLSTFEDGSSARL